MNKFVVMALCLLLFLSSGAALSFYKVFYLGYCDASIGCLGSFLATFLLIGAHGLVSVYALQMLLWIRRLYMTSMLALIGAFILGCTYWIPIHYGFVEGYLEMAIVWFAVSLIVYVVLSLVGSQFKASSPVNPAV